MSKISTIPSQRFLKICFMPSHIVSQSPLKSPENVLRRPVMTSNTVLRILHTISHAALRSGPNALHRSVQILEKSSPKSLTSIPKPCRAPHICSSISLKEATTCDHINFTLFRNSSFVFQRVMNEATNVAIATMTRPIGPVRADSALASAPPAPTPSFA